MAPLKAPSSDGFHALFFQKQWDTIGGEVCDWEQASFIAGRSINENIILAQEVIHSMRSQKNKKWMAIKIDLEKAYDRVSWDFIATSLRAAGYVEWSSAS